MVALVRLFHWCLHHGCSVLTLKSMDLLLWSLSILLRLSLEDALTNSSLGQHPFGTSFLMKGWRFSTVLVICCRVSDLVNLGRCKRILHLLLTMGVIALQMCTSTLHHWTARLLCIDFSQVLLVLFKEGILISLNHWAFFWDWRFAILENWHWSIAGISIRLFCGNFMAIVVCEINFYFLWVLMWWFACFISNLRGGVRSSFYFLFYFLHWWLKLKFSTFDARILLFWPKILRRARDWFLIWGGYPTAGDHQGLCIRQKRVFPLVYSHIISFIRIDLLLKGLLSRFGDSQMFTKSFNVFIFLRQLLIDIGHL